MGRAALALINLMRARAKKSLVKVVLYPDELEIVDLVYSLRFRRNGWRCWACGQKAKKNVLMHWTINPFGEVIFWDFAACRDLLNRYGIV
jgi:hypothetical protein